ncbi:MAG: SDR family NAD(P)-dependent oxidoreductase [Nanoarchaeota archaeon]|nr:SDR family NAD(P)-dependent oxidoreductase [Nanoarchaeota archaeon]
MNICITGASSGIGKALTEHLIKEGHIVWGIARRKNILEELKKGLPKNKFFFGVCDVRNIQEIIKTKKEMEKNNFFPDIIILGAGVSLNDLKPRYNLETYKKIFSVNLFGAINFIEIFLPDFLKIGKGQFIALSSISAFRPSFRGVAYPASKAALSLTFRGLNLNYKKQGIYFSNIYLGPVKTNMWEGKDSFLVSDPKKIAKSISRVIKTKRLIVFIPFLSTFIFRVSSLIPDRIYALLSERFVK